MNPEWSRPERLDTIGEGDRTIAIEANEPERRKLAGRFGLVSVDRLQASHPAWVKEYFEVSGDGLQVVAALKAHVTLAQHNLLTPLRPHDGFADHPFDLVFLRNVLFYFGREHQLKVLQQVRHSMAREARLILGESESITGLETACQFERPLIYTFNS